MKIIWKRIRSYEKRKYSDKNIVKVSSKYNKSNDNFLWTFIKNEGNSVLIKNKNECLIQISNSLRVTCIVSIQEASHLHFIKIYQEVNHSEEDIKLIEKEPIDILIKYIDLRDPKLNRKGIHQINKDLDNEELRYSIRSILKNIPWFRKIFILMPNEKIRYFKEIKEIQEKIVYIKDKDLLGFDSSSSLVFQFRYWKMKDFNMDDLVNYAKNYGFIFQGSEIYGGLANTWDYGPLGSRLKNAIKDTWRKRFIQERPNAYEVDAAILMHPRVWEASGHVGSFSDPLIDCKHCKTRHRADNLIDDFDSNAHADGMTQEEMMAYIREKKVPCPKCALGFSTS